MVNPGQISKGYAAEVMINGNDEIRAKLLEL
jgi:hypothetical protein